MIFWFYYKIFGGQKCKISMDYSLSKNKANKSSISFYSNKNNYNDFFISINLTLQSEKQKRIMIKASEDADYLTETKIKPYIQIIFCQVRHLQ